MGRYHARIGCQELPQKGGTAPTAQIVDDQIDPGGTPGDLGAFEVLDVGRRRPVALQGLAVTVAPDASSLFIR